MKRLAGKVAIITGAGSGMGASEAYIFAKEGAKVIATDIDINKATEVVNQINIEFPNSAIAIKHDVASEEGWIQVVEEGVKTFGNINVLVNNAGIYAAQPYSEVTLEQFQIAMNINVWSQLVGIRTVVSSMKEEGGGSIINISSLASKNASGGFNAYTASKGAVEAITKAAAIEFASANIRVNSVHPGAIETPLTKSNLTTEEARQAVLDPIPLKRFAQPEEVANLVLFLASDDASYMTGTEQIIDGGLFVKP